MPALRRYVVTQVREVEIVTGYGPADAVALAEDIFNPTAETLIENQGKPLKEPKIVSISAVDTRR